jgi:methylated-DNA-[protein]-cysteine S-methyltransferase
LHLDQLTAFQQQVLEAVAAIPCGSVLTYTQVAAQVGRPRAARAVGAALGANPWPVLVPCHRVVGAAGQLVGFSAPGGVATKARMLQQEQAGEQASPRPASHLPGVPADCPSTAAPFCR